jgi:hypothetical protein
MKMCLAAGQPRPLDRSKAVACLAANVALPGSGSLLAGRRSGYAQVTLSLLGLLLTGLFAAAFVQVWVRLGESPFSVVYRTGELPEQLKPAFWCGVAGIGIFILSLAWAIGTSRSVFREAGRTPPQSN